MYLEIHSDYSDFLCFLVICFLWILISYCWVALVYCCTYYIITTKHMKFKIGSLCEKQQCLMNSHWNQKINDTAVDQSCQGFSQKCVQASVKKKFKKNSVYLLYMPLFLWENMHPGCPLIFQVSMSKSLPLAHNWLLC